MDRKKTKKENRKKRKEWKDNKGEKKMKFYAQTVWANEDNFEGLYMSNEDTRAQIIWGLFVTWVYFKTYKKL